MKRVIDWFEIATTNLERATKFYSEIFQIEMTSMHLANRLRMSLFPSDGSMGGGGALGGSILVPKQQISPEHGYMAVFFDTEGNRVALHSRG